MPKAPGEDLVVTDSVLAVGHGMSVDVISLVAEEIGQRRFKWRLTAPDEADVRSQESFATRREAAAQGEVALQRAALRGRIGR